MSRRASPTDEELAQSISPPEIEATPGEFAPTARGWDIYEIARSDDPHEQWRLLRETTPVLDTGSGVFFVSSWDFVNEILRDARHGAGAGVEASFGEGEGLAFRVMRAWLMSLDGAPHTRARGLVRREFTPRRVEAFEPMIGAIVEQCVGEIEATSNGETVDLIDALAFSLPSQVIRSLFGLDASLWAKAIEPIFRPGDPLNKDGVDMIEAVSQFFDDQMQAKAIPDGLLQALHVPDPELGELSRLEVIANAVLLVTAAIDTTKGLIGNAAQCLLERPELVESIRQNPERIPAVVEETLRFEPPALSCSRYANETFRIGETEIPSGSQLLLGLAAANRDPAHYERPDRFDPDRDQTGLLSFGGGRHFCLGAALARTEARIALERLLVAGRFDFELVEAPVWNRRNPTVRALERLRVRVRAR